MAESEEEFELDIDLVEAPVLAKHVHMIRNSQAKRESSDGTEVSTSKPRKKKAKIEFQPLLPPVIASSETDAAFRLREFMWTEYMIYQKTVKKASSLELEELEAKRWNGMFLKINS
jgi:hypothetical protein